MRRKRAHSPAPHAVAPALHVPLWSALALIVAASLLLYAGSYRNPLLFDDRIISPPTLESFLGYWRTLEPRWLSYGSFGLNYLASGTDLFWYRVANVLLHALVAAALFRFILGFAAATGLVLRQARLAALCAAALFAVHPVAVYDVAYLAQRTSLLAALFCVLSLHAFLAGLVRDDARWLWGSVLLYFAAVSCKEHAVMLPAVALALVLAVRSPDRVLAGRLAAPLAGFAVVALLVALRMKGLLGAVYEPFASAVGEGVPPGPGGADSAEPPAYGASHGRSMLTQAALFFRYLAAWLAPLPQWMSGDIRVAFARSAGDPWHLLGLAAYLAWTIAGLVLLLRRGRAGYFGFAMLLPAFLFLTEFAATRVQEPFVLYRSYLWALSFPLAAAAVLDRLPVRAMIVAALVAAAALSAIARERLETFSSPLKFWDDAVRKNRDPALPFVDRALSNRAAALMQEGRYSEARADLDEAIRLNPKTRHAWINRAILRARENDTQNALADVDQALRLDPGFSEAYLERCILRIKLAQSDLALQDCDRALALEPTYPLALLNRGVLLAERGRLEDALRDFQLILRYAPRHDLALYNAGLVLQQLGRREDAGRALAEACGLGLQPACHAGLRAR